MVARHHRNHHDQFAYSKVRQRPFMGIGTVERALNNLQRIESGDQDSDGCRDSNAEADVVCAKQRQELSDEVSQSRQSD